MNFLILKIYILHQILDVLIIISLNIFPVPLLLSSCLEFQLHIYEFFTCFPKD